VGGTRKEVDCMWGVHVKRLTACVVIKLFFSYHGLGGDDNLFAIFDTSSLYTRNLSGQVGNTWAHRPKIHYIRLSPPRFLGTNETGVGGSEG
jgi:hypothetical protein